MDERLYEIVLCLVSIVCIVITRYVIPYIKSQTSASQLEQITDFVSRAVEAAEVLFNIPHSGEAKREYVINLVNEKFNSKGVVITEEQIRALLESAWKQMNDTSRDN